MERPAGETRGWPESFADLIRELRSARARPALIVGSDVGADRLIGRLSPRADHVISLGDRVRKMDQPPSTDDLLTGISDHATLLTDIEVLFAPAMRVDVMSQLRRTSQNTALIVVWPGQIAGGRLSYSLPGRFDHVDEPARDLVVLRPTQADFPDEVPYTLERYPA